MNFENNKSLVIIFVFFVYVIIGLEAFFLSILYPFHNWDMIMYIASAESFEEKDAVKLQNFVKEELKKSVSEFDYKLMQSSYYGKCVFEDPEVFSEQVCYYKMRVVYNFLIFLFYKWGLNIVFASHFISAVSVFIGLIIMFFIGKKFFSPSLLLLFPFFSITFGLFNLSRISSPDGMVFLLCIFSVYLFINRKFTFLLFLLPFLVGVRSELLIFNLLLYLILWFGLKKHKKIILFSFFMSILFYLLLITYFNHPGYGSLFYFTFLNKKLLLPLKHPHSLTIWEYLLALTIGVLKASEDKVFVLFLLTSLLYLMGLSKFFALSKFRFDKKIFEELKGIFMKMFTFYPEYLIGVVSISYVFIHFFLFPMVRFRFFATFYIITIFSIFSFFSKNIDILIKRSHIF